MELRETRDREQLYAFLSRDPGRYTYLVGDLDAFFWPYTRWWVSGGAEVDGVALLYGGCEPPALLLFHPDESWSGRALAALDGELPGRCYGHFEGDVDGAIAGRWEDDDHGVHVRMVLDRATARVERDTRAVRATVEDEAELLGFYAAAYPGNAFDPRMLETGYYRVVREGGAVVAVAGVHVVSAELRIASLGNVTTAPAARRRGLARAVVATLCADLLEVADVVALNVHHANAGAIRLYESLGFVEVLRFRETMLTRLGSQAG